MADSPANDAPPILVVDDEDAKRYAVGRILRQAGFATREATTGAEALRAAAEGAALVVLDVRLPDIDGFEICRRLKADPATASIPVLHLSATFVDAENRVQGLESGADAYLTDTAEAGVLVATVRALLRMRRAEETSRRLARQWQTTFDAIRDGIVLMDADGRVARANAALGELVGRPADKLRGEAAADLHPALAGAEARAAFRGALAGRRATAEVRLGDRWHHLTADPVPADPLTGAPAGAVAVLADVTGRRAAEEALRTADRRKDEFLAMLAHELRNPLGPVLNALQAMGGPAAGPHTFDGVRAIATRQIRHMSRLIDDLLDVSRVTRGKIALRREPIDLAAAAARAAELARPMIEARRHALSVSLPAAPLPIDADAMRVEQSLTNLLNNAAKYTEPGGLVALEVAREGADAVARVRDTGIGIPADLLPHVFDLFMQADRSLDHSQGGLGIGLSLVKHLVELHGGTVEVRSDGPGRGSEFVVRLPALPESALAAKTTEAPAGAGSPATPRRVLIVDDNEDATETLATLLEMGGHRAFVAHAGPAGVAAALRERPEVALVDIGLPGMDGCEVARRLRREPTLAGLRLYALTGYARDEDRQRSEEAGFDGHLVKPIDSATLDGILSRLPPRP